jgi:hypothetical protein
MLGGIAVGLRSITGHMPLVGLHLVARAGEVKQHLKGRGRALSLYDVGESMLAQPHWLVYER